MAASRIFHNARESLKNPAILAMFALFLINLCSYADRAVLTVLQEPIKRDLGLSDVQLGLLAGPIFAIFYSVAGFPIARIAESKNRKRIILTGVYLWSTFTALCGAAQNFAQLALFRMGVGAAEAAAPPATHSLIADYFPRAARGRAMAVLALGIPLGVLVGGLIGGIVAQYAGWRIAFLALGVPGILIALLGGRLLFEAKRTSDHHQVDGTPLTTMQCVKSLLSIPVYRLLLVCAMLSGNASHAISTFSASFFIRTHGMDLAEVGSVLMTTKGLAGMVGTIFGGWLSDRLDRGRGQDYLLVPAIGSAISATCLWFGLTMASEGMALILFVVAAFFGAWIVSPAFAAVQNVVDPRTRATAAALFLFCVTVLGAAGPVAVGWISDMVAAQAMNMDASAYLAACPGGKAAPGLEDMAARCGSASTVGLARGMMIGVGLHFAAAVVYLLAVREGRRPTLVVRAAE